MELIRLVSSLQILVTCLQLLASSCRSPGESDLHQVVWHNHQWQQGRVFDQTLSLQ